jgi:hypothetical protein
VLWGCWGEGKTYGRLELAAGDRVICRRNDAPLDVDNGMRGTVRELDSNRVVIETDAGAVRELPAVYVEEHVEHAYALTGHSMQGGTVERAIVVASPRDLTASWSYTALSRARGETRVLIIDTHDDERSEVAPADCVLSREPLLARLTRRMLERDDEDLAVEQLPAGPDEIELAGGIPSRGSVNDVAARRALQRMEDLNQRALRLTIQHTRLTQQLNALPAVTHGRGDPRAIRCAYLDQALRDCRRGLELVLDQRSVLLRDPAEVRSGLVRRERAIAELDQEPDVVPVTIQRDVDVGRGWGQEIDL